MAYDAKTYGQSPFGGAKQNGQSKDDADPSGGLDELPEKLSKDPKATEESSLNPGSTNAAARVTDASKASSKARFPGQASPSPTATHRFAPLSGTSSSLADSAASTAKSASQSASSAIKADTASPRKSRRTSGKTTARKGKKSNASKTPKSEIDPSESTVSQRFLAEDRSAYLSLLYKTGISGLVWAVLRLSRYELSNRAITLINIAIHPLTIAAIAFIAAIGLTFWMRYLLNDLAVHTQQLHSEAEAPDGTNYRPTLEIVGDALEYNPKFRKNLAILFNAASILICSLVSYLIAFVLFPTE